ncbi:hypothetical protein SESBI_30417 [Sesbania bispinosa]|nr:hypothetical protein SESBI_30417 [Sesbania bispinosa]
MSHCHCIRSSSKTGADGRCCRCCVPLELEDKEALQWMIDDSGQQQGRCTTGGSGKRRRSEDE